MTFKDEKCHGGKHSKERVTLLLAANMDGSQKLRPLIIGKAANPRCFKGVKSFPTSYRSNKKAWMTTELFNEWLVALDQDMKREHRKILLFLDNCTVHNNTPTLHNVKLHFFPANTTSRLQPLDQGVINNFKTYYRKEVVKMVLDSIENEQTANITILTAMTLADKAWRNVTATTVANCFRKSGFIKESIHRTSVQQTENALLDADVSDCWSLLPPLEGNLDFRDFVQVDNNVAIYGVLSDADIIDSTENKAEDDDDDEHAEPLPPVTLKDAKSSFEKLRNYFLGTEVSEDVFSALNTMDNALDSARWGKLNQKKITDFFNNQIHV